MAFHDAISSTDRYTLDEFEQFIDRPTNQDRTFEFIGGEIVEVPSNPYVSAIASRISFFIMLFLQTNRIAGNVTGEAGAYIVGDERYAPDVAYISAKRQPRLNRTSFNPNPPELAVEVISPSDDMRRLTIKIANYMLVGTLVWVVYPESREVHIYQSGHKPQILTIDDALSGAPILPGLTIPVKDIFPVEDDTVETSDAIDQS